VGPGSSEARLLQMRCADGADNEAGNRLDAVRAAFLATTEGHRREEAPKTLIRAERPCQTAHGLFLARISFVVVEKDRAIHHNP
jgi:hypothetical protein